MAFLHHVNAIPPWIHWCLADEAKLDEGAGAGGSRYANPRVSDELICGLCAKVWVLEQAFRMVAPVATLKSKLPRDTYLSLP